MGREIYETEETEDPPPPRIPRLSASGIRAIQGRSDVAQDGDDRKPSPNDARQTVQDAPTEHQSASKVQELAGEGLQVQFAPLDSSTYAQYDGGKIKVNQDLRVVAEQEPNLLKPLLAHEAVHARYQSEAPHDEESLRRYVQEEMEAYRTELAAWLGVKDEFYAKYPTSETRERLGEAGQDLLAKYNQLEMQIQEQGWDRFREFLTQKYRQRM